MRLKLIFILFLFILLNPVKAQITHFDLTAFEPLPAIDIGAFLFSNSLKGAPRFLLVSMAPQNIEVSLGCEILWKENLSSPFQFLTRFQTELFPSRDFFNDEIGSAIRIAATETNSAAINKMLKEYGKPVGQLQITMKLFYKDGSPASAEVSRILTFLNPSQTIVIQLPLYNSVQEIGNILAQWEEVPGAEYYIINAKIKALGNVTDEDVLNSGNPLITNANAGLVNIMNLRSVMSREPDYGDEIVMQVEAFIPGPGGGTNLKSNLVKFRINDYRADNNSILLSKLITLFSLYPGNSSNELLKFFNEGSIKLTGFETDNGSLSAADFENLLNVFFQNPDMLVNISFTGNQ